MSCNNILKVFTSNNNDNYAYGIIFQDGSVSGFGNNRSLYHGPEYGMVNSLAIPNINNAVDIAIVPDNYLVLRSDGSVTGWGVGYVPFSLNSIPSFCEQLLIPTSQIGNNATGISAALGRVHAVLKNGNVITWGKTRLSNASYTAATTPQNIQGQTKKIFSFGSESYAILNNGTVTGWQYHYTDGQPKPIDSYVSTSLQALYSLTNVTKISWGNNHLLALLNNGTVFSIPGINNCYDPQTPDWKLICETIPRVNGDITVGIATNYSNVVDISASSNTALVLLRDGTASGWVYGANSFLNNGQDAPIYSHGGGLVPKEIQGNITGISSAYDYSMAVLKNGETVFWGYGGEANQALNNPKCNQTITFPSIPTKTLGNASFNVNATVSSSLPLTYKSSNSGVATIDNNGNINVVGVGLANITAEQIPYKRLSRTWAGNTVGNCSWPTCYTFYYYNYISYNSATLTRSLTVNKISQNITFPEISNKSFGDPAFFLSASSDSNLPLSYSSSNPAIASISGTTGVKINNVGSVTITATQAGNSDFEAAIPVSRSFNVFCDYIQSVSAGTNYSLALLKDGRVTGWGYNFYGETTIPVGIGNNAIKIVAGNGHSLALLKDGRVTGWGRNNVGQLNVPSVIQGNVSDIYSDSIHSFALLNNGYITGWGSSSNRNAPISIQGNVTGIAAGAGESFTLALLKDGRVTGWGDNQYGQTNIPVDIGTGASSISAGHSHSLALLKDGRVTGWGYNFYGQIDIPVGIGTNAAAISAGLYHNLALLKDGSITGWGYNFNGQTTIPVGIGSGASSISAGHSHSLALLKDGRVTGWGNNSRGEINVPKSINCAFGKPYQNITFPEISDKNYGSSPFYLSGYSDSNLPISYSSSNSSIASIISGSGIQVKNFGNVTITASQNGNSNFEPAIPVSRSFNVVCDYIQSISARERFSLALLKDGRVTGWGDNSLGQTTIPVGIGTGASQVSAGFYHSLALLKDGSVTGWGSNVYGETTIPVGIGTGAAQVSAGDYHSIALLKDGRVTGWGYNNYGQTTIPVGIGTGAAQVSAGAIHSLALLKDGRVSGWGLNNYGQTTIPVGIGTGAAQVSAGWFHSLALLKDGRVTGWGQNVYGETTIPVGIGTNAAQVSAGNYHSIALLKDGRVTGWGYNNYGQTTIPVGIGTGAAQVSAGWFYSLALLKDGRVTGWGNNDYSQLNVPRTLNCLPLNSSRVISAPTSTYILSGQSLSNAPLIGGSGDVSGAFSWTDPSFVPPNVGRFSYSVTFVPSDIGSYATSTTVSFVNVLGITNIITKPIGTSIKYGQTLVNSNLTNGVANVPGTFNWTNPQTIVNNVGVYNYPVTFIPTSEYYINALTDANLNITKANQTINFPNIPVINKTITSSYNLNATSDNNQTPITYTSSDTNIATINGNVLVILNEGTCVITAKQNETSNYLESNSISRNLQVVTLRAPNILTVSNLPNGVYYDEVTQCIIGEITDQGNYHIKIYIQEGEEICEKTLILNVSDKNKKYIYGVNNPVNIGFIKYNPQDRINQQAIIQLYDNPKYGKMLIHSKLGIIYGYSKDIEQKIEAYNHPVYGYILRDSIGGIIYGYTGDFVNDPNFINSLYGL